MKKNIMTLVAILITLATQAQTATTTNPVDKEAQEMQTILSNPEALHIVLMVMMTGTTMMEMKIMTMHMPGTVFS